MNKERARSGNPHPNLANLKPFKPGQDHPRYKRGPAPKPRLSNGLSLTDLFRTYTVDAAVVLGKILNDPREETETRLKAASIILARGWGDVPKHLSVSAINETARAIELTEQQLIAIASSVESGIRQAQTIDVEPEPDKK